MEIKNAFHWNTGEPSIFVAKHAFNGVSEEKARKSSMAEKKHIVFVDPHRKTKPRKTKRY